MDIRTLTDMDIPALQAHLLALSEDERISRFNGTMSDYAIATYCAGRPRECSLGSGVFVGGELVAVCESGHVGDGAVEAAVSVLSGWQGRGFGTAVARREVVACEVAGRTEVRFVVEPGNWRMLRVAKRCGATAECDGRTWTVRLSKAVR